MEVRMRRNSRIGRWLLFIAATAPVWSVGQSYRSADLPDAMTFLDGRTVGSPEDFQRRKEEIRDLWCRYYIGHFPEETPGLLSAETVRQEKKADGSSRKRVVLTFDTPGRQSFEIELWLPSPRPVPVPLLLVAPYFKHIPWAEEALRRGYMICFYPGLDAHHEEPDYPGYQDVWRRFQSEYPGAGWSSSLGIQTWLAGRTLDYLLDPRYGYGIDAASVGTIGHSRYGLQALYAAAFDERIKSVVARSSGTPVAAPYRFSARQSFMESVAPEDCPAVWILPGLRDYLGRENELPVDGNALLAAVAPRRLLLHTAYHDGGDPTFAVERGYLDAKKAYAFLGAAENIRLVYRAGGHNPITDEHVQLNIDFFDRSFGRGNIPPSRFEEKLIHQFDWNAWKDAQPSPRPVVPGNAAVPEKIAWMLGEQPERIAHEGEYHIPPAGELGVDEWSRDRWKPEGLKRVPFSFSGKMSGNIYFDPGLDRYKATVIWLHPWNYSHGSNESYGVQGTTVYWRLAKEGYVVVAYDQFGFGDHLLRAVDFYAQYPRWSKLGRAVYDVRKVVDFLVDGQGIAAEEIPPADPSKIYICGFAYGGMVGLYAAALDKRIAGVASFSGFTPMRSDTDEKPTGGLKQYYQWHAILPRLGLFSGKEQELPFDYDDVIGLIAPRNCLVYAPLRDRFADPEAIRNCIDKAKEAWNAPGALVFRVPDDICRFQKEQQNVVVDWLNKLVE